MRTKQLLYWPVSLMVAMSIPLLAQTLTPPANPDLPAVETAPHAATYTFPHAKQEFSSYLYNTFGPPALISTAVGAALDQAKPAPPEWDSGAKGYGERYGWRFGMSLVGETTKYSLGALMHEDVAFHRCQCRGIIPRTFHALTATLTAKTPGGRTVFSVPALVSPYAGSFTAMNARYPARYGPTDAFRVGSISFAFKAVGNLVGEFLAPRR